MQREARTNKQVARRWYAPPDAVCNSTLWAGKLAQAAVAACTVRM